MSAIGAILPILILLLLFILMSRGLKKVTINLSSKKNLIILSGYIGILLVFVCMFFFLPDDKFVKSEQMAEGEKKSVYDRLLAKESVEGVARRERVPYGENRLVFRAIDYPEFSILYERDPELDNELLLSIYHGNAMVDNIDISSFQELPSFYFEGDVLIAHNGTPVDVKLYYINPSFSYRQFNDIDLLEHSGGYFNGAVIHVKIPEDLEVIHDPTIDVVEIK